METFKKGRFIYNIDFDSEAYSPRENDNMGNMVCFHRRHSLGDNHNISSDNFDSWSELKEYLIKEHNAFIILPLFLLDHSALSMKTTTFISTWDSGQVGFIYVTKEDVRKNFLVKKVTKKIIEQARKVLISEVKEYDIWLQGEIHYFSVFDENNNCIDSCGNFYSKDECIIEAKSSIEWQQSLIVKKHLYKVKSWIKNKVNLKYRAPLEI